MKAKKCIKKELKERFGYTKGSIFKICLFIYVERCGIIRYIESSV